MKTPVPISISISISIPFLAKWASAFATKSLEGVEPHALTRPGELTPSERGDAATREEPKPRSERATVNNISSGRKEGEPGAGY